MGWAAKARAIGTTTAATCKISNDYFRVLARHRVMLQILLQNTVTYITFQSKRKKVQFAMKAKKIKELVTHICHAKFSTDKKTLTILQAMVGSMCACDAMRFAKSELQPDTTL